MLLFVGPLPMVWVNHPDLVKEIVMKDPDRLTKGISFKNLHILIGEKSIINLEGDEWRKKRATMKTGFSVGHLLHSLFRFVSYRFVSFLIGLGIDRTPRSKASFRSTECVPRG